MFYETVGGKINGIEYYTPSTYKPYVDEFLALWSEELKNLGIKTIHHHARIKPELETDPEKAKEYARQLRDAIITLHGEIAETTFEAMRITKKPQNTVKLIRYNIGTFEMDNNYTEYFDVVLYNEECCGKKDIVVAYVKDRNIFFIGTILLNDYNSYARHKLLIDLLKVAKGLLSLNQQRKEWKKAYRTIQYYSEVETVLDVLYRYPIEIVRIPPLEAYCFHSEKRGPYGKLTVGADGWVTFTLEDLKVEITKVYDSQTNTYVVLNKPIYYYGDLKLMLNLANSELNTLSSGYIDYYGEKIRHPNIDNGVCNGSVKLPKYDGEQELCDYFSKVAEIVIEKILAEPNIGSAYNKELAYKILDEFQYAVSEVKGIAWSGRSWGDWVYAEDEEEEDDWEEEDEWEEDGPEEEETDTHWRI